MVAKTLRMKNGSSVRKMARNPLSIAVRPAVLSDARPHSDCTTWWSRPNLFSVGVEDRLILGRYTLVAERISRRAVVEGLRQFEEPIEGTRVALERLLPQPQQDGMLRRHPPRPSLFIEPDGNLERPFDIAAKIADAFLLAARVARSARLEPAVLRRLPISDREAVIGGLVCHEIAPLSLRVCASIVRNAARTGRDPLSGDPLSGQAVALSALTAVLPVSFCQRLIVTS